MSIVLLIDALQPETLTAFLNEYWNMGKQLKETNSNFLSYIASNKKGIWS
jgi:hypothetical protein